MSIVAKSTIAISVAVIVGLIIAIIIVKICNTNGKFKTDYDERQKIMIGKGYKYAMITAWGLLAAYIVIDMGGVVLPIENSVMLFTILFISIMVHTCYTVWTDAYWGRNNKYGRYVIMFVIITFINLLAAVASIMEGDMIVNGVLTHRAINAECGFMFLIIGVEMWIKSVIDKKKNGEEYDDEES